MKKLTVTLLLSILPVSQVWAETTQNCIQRAITQAADETTLGEIRLNCQKNPDDYTADTSDNEPGSEENSAPPKAVDVDDKRELELMAAENPYGISPHKRNYMMPLTYNRRPNGEVLGLSDRDLDEAEVKFQFSYKVPLLQQILGQPIDFFFAYSNQSYWQAYLGSASRPFRETNHEPELFITWTDPWVPTWVEHAQYSAGVSHQSNGRGSSGDLSRSWNRVYLSTLLQHQNYYLGLKVWDRLADPPKDSPDDPRGDDNPDIEKYMGHFELELSRVNAQRSFSVMLRNNLRRGENLGAMQLDYSFPLSKTLRGYIQYFGGYGESMIDYNHNVQRLGIGIAISDWP